MKVIEHNGMQVKWHFTKTDVVIEIHSPEKGWIALGFNPKNDIVGSNLIMAAVRKGALQIEDQYVSAFAKHEAVEKLGGKSTISSFNGFEDEKGTHVSFRIEGNRSDEQHYRLEKGKEIYLILAYSLEDDFEHHSIMRKHLRVKL